MTKSKTKENRVEKVRHEVEDFAREWWLTGLGAVATVSDETTKVWDRLAEFLEGGISVEKFRELLEEERKDWVEKSEKLQQDLAKKGEKFEKSQREAMKKWLETIRSKREDVRENVSQRISEPVESLYETVQEKVAEVLENLDIPTMDELGKLNVQIDSLMKKVDELSKKLEQSAKQTTAQKTSPRPTKKAAAK